MIISVKVEINKKFSSEFIRKELTSISKSMNMCICSHPCLWSIKWVVLWKIKCWHNLSHIFKVPLLKVFFFSFSFRPKVEHAAFNIRLIVKRKTIHKLKRLSFMFLSVLSAFILRKKNCEKELTQRHFYIHWGKYKKAWIKK